jgi:hypothetical protein
MNELTAIKIKDIETLIGVSKPTAIKLRKDIKSEYNTPIVTLYHVKKYLKIT